jgi:electron transfer flavoprotein alpha subunit
MINCLICIKYVPENIGNSGIDIQREGTVSKINPADMFAIEEAVRIKEKFDGIANGLCMGVSSAENALKTAIAIGLDEVYLLSDKVFAGSDTLATSYILSKGIQKTGKYDLILCGKQSTDGDTGQVGQEIASHLDLPCITNVVDIQFDENDIVCKVLDDNGYIYLKSKLPAVVCVLKGINEPRIPTIEGLLKSQKSMIKKIDSLALGVNIDLCGLHGSPTRVKRTKAYMFAKRPSIDISNNYIEKLEEIIKVNKYSEKINVIEETMHHNNSLQNDEIWVVIEIIGERIIDVSLEILSKAKELALSSGKKLSAVILGMQNEEILTEITTYGVDIIYIFSQPLGRFNEAYPRTLVNACKIYKPSVLMFGSTVWGKWVAPYIAVKLQTGLIADCIELKYDEDGNNLIQTRVAFGGNILADVFIPDKRPQIATIRRGIFKKIIHKTAMLPQIIDINGLIDMKNRIETITSHNKENVINDGVNLLSANILVVGGKGVGKENFPLLCEFATLIGGAVGATRYAVDSGWVDYERQIGQTGITVRPRLYIAFGVSGASEHLVGMRESGYIVSINTDPDAPIMSISDCRIIADCGDVLRSLIAYFEKEVKT